MKHGTILFGRFIKRHSGWDRVPKPGDRVLACCPDEVIKTVDTVELDDGGGGSVFYTDGTSDSLRHCGWEHVTNTEEWS